MQDVLDSLMSFDPSSMDAFKDNDAPKSNPNIYKTNPKDTKSEDGHYRAKVRVIYNPYDYSKSIVSKTEWYCQGGPSGSFMVNAPLESRENDKTNPLAQASSKVFLAQGNFAELFAKKNIADPTKRATMIAEFNAVTGRGKEAWQQKFKGTELGQMILDYAKSTFDNTTSTWAPVQILEDNNKPELVGQIKLMKLPKVVLTRLNAKMNPSEEAKKAGAVPVDLMSWTLGYPLVIEVVPGPDDPQHPERKQREISYDLCDFSTDFEPIIKTDGTPLFTDEQLEALEEFATARKDATTAKAAAKKATAAAKIAAGSELYNKVRELTGIAYNYLKDEAKMINIVDEIAYKPWDDAMKARVQEWIDEVTLTTFEKSLTSQPEVTETTPFSETLGIIADNTVDSSDVDMPF